MAPTPTIKGTVNTAAAASITLPTHAIGDLIIVYAGRASTAVVPKPAASGTVPAWNDIDANAGVSACSCRSAYFVATASNHTSGTWTNASHMIALVITGGTFNASPPIGGHGEVGSTQAINASVTGKAITLSKSDGSSMILDFYQSSQLSSWSAAPSGSTRQAAVGKSCLNTVDVTTSGAAVAQPCTTAGAGGQTSDAIEIIAPVTTLPNLFFPFLT